MLCYYGCGNEAKFLTTTNKNCCSEKYNSCPANRKKNSDGIIKAHKDGRLSAKTLSNKGWRKNLLNETENTFTYGAKGNHKAILIKERGHICESCKNEKWLDNIIPLELDHVDGDRKNNTRENLKLLCCNCHALTPTWRGKNKKRPGSIIVEDDVLIAALNNSCNIKEALLKVGLAAKGGNYNRCYKLMRM